jgi:hypothetical protein
MLWRKLFLIFQASLLGFKIQLKPEQTKSIINLLRGEDVIAILPTLRDTEKVWSSNYTLSPNQTKVATCQHE